MANQFKKTSRTIKARPHNLGADGNPEPEKQRESLFNKHDWTAFDQAKVAKMPSREFAVKPAGNSIRPAAAPVPKAAVASPRGEPEFWESQKLTLGGEKVRLPVPDQTVSPAPVASKTESAETEGPKQTATTSPFDSAMDKRIPGWSKMLPAQRKAALTPTDSDDDGNTYTLTPGGEIRTEYDPKRDRRIIMGHKPVEGSATLGRRAMAVPKKYGGKFAYGAIEPLP